MSTRTLNKAVIIGNVGADPKLDHTGGGTPVCTFRVATNRTWKPSGSNDTKEETQWHGVVAFGKFADVCYQVVKKSQKVYIEGRIKTTKFDRDDGSEFEKTEIVADKMEVLDDGHSQSNFDDADYDYQPSGNIYP